MNLYIPESNRSDHILAENLRKYLQEEVLLEKNADLNIIIGDTDGMFNKALELFRNNEKFVHYGAGCKNVPISCTDDINRHMITLMSEGQLCESYRCKRRVKKLFKAIGLKANAKVLKRNIHLYDFIDLKWQSEPYNLILYNSPSKIKEIFIRPSEIVEHNAFLNLIKNCKNFYTNSSAGYYEARSLIKRKQIKWLGERNANRC